MGVFFRVTFIGGCRELLIIDACSGLRPSLGLWTQPSHARLPCTLVQTEHVRAFGPCMGASFPFLFIAGRQGLLKMKACSGLSPLMRAFSGLLYNVNMLRHSAVAGVRAFALSCQLSLHSCAMQTCSHSAPSIRGSFPLIHTARCEYSCPICPEESMFGRLAFAGARALALPSHFQVE